MKQIQYTRSKTNKKAGFSWGLTVIAVLVITVLISLGCWQWRRAVEKEILLANFKQQQSLPTQLVKTFGHKDWTYRQVHILGQFDTEHVFYHMNRFYQHQYGYELLVPFHMQQGQWVLVNMGWVPGHVTPDLGVLIKRHQVFGRLMPGQRSAIQFKQVSSAWPREVLFANPKKLEKMALVHFYPLILKSNKPIVGGHNLPVQLTSIKPIRHKAYALQWFSFSGIALVIYVILMRRRREKHG